MYFDLRDKELPSTRSEKIFTLIISIVLLVLLVIEIGIDYEPKKISVILFCLFWILLVGIHELAHAIVAVFLGWRVDRIVIGFGKILCTTKVFGIATEIRRIPIEGFILHEPQATSSNKKTRLQNALIYFAGPGSELLVFAVLIFLMEPQSLFSVTNSYPKIILQCLAFSALIGGIINLIPHGIITVDGEIPNDGLGIIRCLFK